MRPVLSTPLHPLRRGAALLGLLVAACGPAIGGAPSGDGAARTLGTARAAAFASAAAPVVVELFQSQGCSSCPPANANVNVVAARPDVLALSFGVTYWDQLGWKDSFARPEYTARQWEYARHAGRGNVATPQVVINGGGTTVVGSNAGQLAAAIAAAGSPKGGPAISAGAKVVRLAGGQPALSAVWLVRYDPAVRQVAVRAGENGGQTLPHRDVVRQLVRLGDLSGATAQYPLPAASEAGLRSAVLVQQGTGGPITAARRL